MIVFLTLVDLIVGGFFAFQQEWFYSLISVNMGLILLMATATFKEVKK